MEPLKKVHERLQRGNGISINVAGENPDLRELQNDVREIKEMNRRRFIPVSDGTVELYKNLRRKYKSN